MYRCEYVYSNRRTLAVEVPNSETVRFHVPRCTKKRELDAFSRQVQGWVAKKLLERQKTETVAARFRYGRFLLGGKEYPVEVGSYSAPLFSEKLYCPSGLEPRLVIKDLLMRIAREELARLALQLAEKFRLPMPTVLLTQAHTQWGNCNGSHIRLHYALVSLPAELCEYVILHELVHLIHMDHSPRFWATLSRLMPDCKERRKALKEYQWLLAIY